MQIRMQCFARLQELVGAKEIWLDLPEGARVEQCRAELLRRFPTVEQAAMTLLVARNGRYAQNDEMIEPYDELACFPPVSGG